MQAHAQDDQMFSRLLQARLPRQISDAVDEAASMNYMTRSQYARSALIEKLRADGVIPTPHVAIGS